VHQDGSSTGLHVHGRGPRRDASAGGRSRGEEGGESPDDADSPAPESSTPSLNEPTGATIMVVEDEDAVRTLTHRILTRHGYRVIEYATPADALSGFETPVDLLLTDVVMPEMSGPALAQRLIELRPELRVLFISGYADVAVQPQIGGPNVNFLSKPFQASALTARVAQILGANARAEVRP